ncbi:MAG: RdgB/HAM1 family non-canonical purine NTP pyrophosphatase [Gammaproteobacteria bacterium]|nr:non-canonical purine NTP pyrophosphatase, RdgB/HAM1 family [Gammaproteobacteria bacterium]
MTRSEERWVVATANRGKLAEIQAILAGTGLTLVAQSELGIEPAEESAPTFVENALLKARHAARASSLPAIADDSGLVVDALGGQPGVRSARFAGPDASDEANIERLLSALEGVPEAQRTARFHCVIVAMRSADDPAPVIAAGTWEGKIALHPSGSNGFGYDPVFVIPSLGCTAAELPPGRKNELSHRAGALRELARQLRR